jgi:hypothetical protein
VVEQRMTGERLDDARALAEGLREAAARGAEAVFLPALLDARDLEAGAVLADALEGLPGVHAVSHEVSRGACSSGGASLEDRLGPIAILHGDACVDMERLRAVADSGPSVLVMTPGAESDLQAEAFVELAVALSDSVAGLVILAEAVGAEAGQPGHGGSAIVLLGDVVSESLEADGAILFADVPEPVGRPGSPDAVPELPTILAQRYAKHAGLKQDLGYLAELG